MSSSKVTVEASYHPLLFTLLALVSAAELGLTAYLMTVGNEDGVWPSKQICALLIVLLFNASWSLLFASIYILYLMDGARHLLANVASSVIWLLVTSSMWGVGAGLMRRYRPGGDCTDLPALSQCRQLLTAEALAWGSFSLCAFIMVLTLLWIIGTELTRRKLAKESMKEVACGSQAFV